MVEVELLWVYLSLSLSLSLSESLQGRKKCILSSNLFHFLEVINFLEAVIFSGKPQLCVFFKYLSVNFWVIYKRA